MEEDDVEIAAAMGFASFGGTKKRKFDPTNSPKAKADASGANSTKLGVRSKRTAGTREEEVFQDTTISPAHQAPQSQAQIPDTAQEATAPSGLAAFLARGQTLPEGPLGTQKTESALEQEDSAATETLSFGGPPVSRAELNALRFGVKDENGDTAYFLPSFLEGPWEKLMKNGRA
ncbi:hypothetical protein BKA66DRAFT_41658 [Pyrenochaeta sp. MPI-SDFR-AT-0127]|nr:hypothetical protein BKA66DRAFT_41658 [Pyrenochaeta sp. MPI-SDFR-AT-0127]